MNEKATFLNDESRHGFMNFLVKSKLIIDKKLACILIVYENHLKSLNIWMFTFNTQNI